MLSQDGKTDFTKQDTLNMILKVYILFETKHSQMSFTAQNFTIDMQIDYTFEFNPYIKIFSLELPYMQLNSPFEVTVDNTTICGNLNIPLKQNPLSNFFIFDRNITTKCKDSKEITNNMDECVILYSYFSSIINQFICKSNNFVASEGDRKLSEDLFAQTIQQIQDLITCYNALSDKKYSIRSYEKLFKYLDNQISQKQKEDYPTIFLMISLIGGIFSIEYYKNTRKFLEYYEQLLEEFSKANEETVLMFQKHILMKNHLLNGYYMLMHMAIKEGISGWVKIMKNESIMRHFFKEEDDRTGVHHIFLKSIDFIGRCSSEMKTTSDFSEVRDFLMKMYEDYYSNKENSGMMLKMIWKSISLVSLSKEQLIETLIDYFNRGLITFENLIDFQEEIKRKKWSVESVENFESTITKIFELIAGYNNNVTDSNREEDKLFHLQSLLYGLSNKVKYLFILLKFLKYEKIDLNLMIGAFHNTEEFSIDDIVFILNDLQNIPEDIKQEIINEYFLHKISTVIRNLQLPFNNEQVKNTLLMLLLNREVFVSGSLNYVKDLIQKQPTMQDLDFIIRNLALPQKNCNKEVMLEVFLLIITQLLRNFTEIEELTKNFSYILHMIDTSTDIELKMDITQQFLCRVKKIYSPQVLLGLLREFNHEDEEIVNNRKSVKYDIVFEKSYIEFIKNDILSHFEGTLDKVNQIFQAISIINPVTKQSVLFSNSITTENIIITILDHINKASNLTKLIKISLFLDPNQDHFWYKLITAKGNCTSFLKHQYVISLTNCILGAFEEFQNGDLLIHEYIVISKQTPVQRRAFISYIEACDLTKNKLNKERIIETIESRMNEVNGNLHLISEVEKFLSFNGRKIEMKEYEDIVSFLSQTKSSVKYINLKSFRLHDCIMCSKDQILEINKWTDMDIFTPIFQAKLNQSSERMGFNSVIALALDSISYIRNNLIEITSNNTNENVMENIQEREMRVEGCLCQTENSSLVATPTQNEKKQNKLTFAFLCKSSSGFDGEDRVYRHLSYIKNSNGNSNNLATSPRSSRSSMSINSELRKASFVMTYEEPSIALPANCADDDLKIFCEIVNESTNSKNWKKLMEDRNTLSNEPVPLLLKSNAIILGFTKEEIFEAISNENIRKEWDTAYSELKVIETNAKEEWEILYMTIKFPSIFVSDREFVLKKRFWKNFPNNNSIILLFKSVNHNQCPPRKKYVRAETIISGYYIQTLSTDPHKIQLTIVSQNDYKGNLPVWFVNSISQKAPKEWVNNLVKGCEIVRNLGK